MNERNKNDAARARERDAGRTSRRLRGLARRVVDGILQNDPVTSVLFVVGVTLLLSAQQCAISFGDLDVGTVADRDYRAPFELEVEDEEDTRLRREAAREQAPPVYRRDPSVQEDGRERLLRFFETGRSFLAEHVGAHDFLQGEGREVLRDQLALPVDSPTLDILLRVGFSAQLEADLLNAYRRVMMQKIVANPPILGKATCWKYSLTHGSWSTGSALTLRVIGAGFSV